MDRRLGVSEVIGVLGVIGVWGVIGPVEALTLVLGAPLC